MSVVGGLRGGTATSVSGLYYTGVKNNGSLQDGDQDTHWAVTYARVGGTEYTSGTYVGNSYVVDGNAVDGNWVANSSTAQWITSKGASAAGSGGTTNSGGDFLPGNGTSGNNSAYFVYRLAFTINGSGVTGSDVTNKVSISLTIAADDQYTVYVNPASAPTVDANGNISAGGTAASGSRQNAWNNTASLALQNYDSTNANFKIGTNYLYVVVANTNNQTGASNSNALNPSGLLVYQVGATATSISPNPVPEVGTWLPVAAAVGLFGLRRLKRRPEFTA